MPSLSDRFRAAGEQISRSGPEVIPGWLMTAGVAAWLIVGIAALLALVGWLFVYSASISIPLLLAVVIGMVAYPLCQRMIARGVSKAVAAWLVLALLVLIVAAVVWIVVAGIISQWPSILAQVQQGIAAVAAQLQTIGFSGTAVRSALERVASGFAEGRVPVSSGILTNLGSALASGVSGVFALLFGLFIGATLLYYVLKDFPTMADWVSRHMGGLPKHVSDGIIEDAVGAMRGYFRGTTITGLVVATVIGLSMVLLKVPLAATVALVTFLTCYIPFLGAIISGAFAFVVALGANGLPTAVVLLVIVLVAQNLLQTVISARVMGSSLNLHPFVVLVVTMLGGIFGGLLGAALGAPLAALLINAGKRLSAALAPVGVGEAFEAQLAEHAE